MVIATHHCIKRVGDAVTTVNEVPLMQTHAMKEAIGVDYCRFVCRPPPPVPVDLSSAPAFLKQNNVQRRPTPLSAGLA